MENNIIILTGYTYQHDSKLTVQGTPFMNFRLGQHPPAMYNKNEKSSMQYFRCTLFGQDKVDAFKKFVREGSTKLLISGWYDKSPFITDEGKKAYSDVIKVSTFSILGDKTYISKGAKSQPQQGSNTSNSETQYNPNQTQQYQQPSQNVQTNVNTGQNSNYYNPAAQQPVTEQSEQQYASVNTGSNSATDQVQMDEDLPF